MEAPRSAIEPMVTTFDPLVWPALKTMEVLGGSATDDELPETLVELGAIPETVQNVMHIPVRSPHVGPQPHQRGKLVQAPLL
jgi:hypothetical protein